MTHESTTGKRRLMKPLELVFLIIAILILLTVGLQECGVKVVQQTDDTEIIQKPHR